MMFKPFVPNKKLSAIFTFIKLKPISRFEKWLKYLKLKFTKYPNYPHFYHLPEEGSLKPKNQDNDRNKFNLYRKLIEKSRSVKM